MADVRTHPTHPSNEYNDTNNADNTATERFGPAECAKRLNKKREEEFEEEKELYFEFAWAKKGVGDLS